jgi:hypothetical protein
MNPDTRDPAAFAPPGLPQSASEPDRNNSRRDNQDQAAEMEDTSYGSVPPKQTLTVSVRYRIHGRGQPLPYPLDEE